MTAKFFVNGYNTCEHRDENGNKEYTWYEHDARGYPLGGRMCHLCMDEVEADNRRRPAKMCSPIQTTGTMRI